MNEVHVTLRAKDSEDISSLLRRIAAWIATAPKDRTLSRVIVYDGDAPVDSAY